jgi:hypothetical protein
VRGKRAPQDSSTSTADRTLVLGYHFPFLGVGNVARDGSAYRWVPEQWRWD